MPTHHLTADLLDPAESPGDWTDRLSALGLLQPPGAPAPGSPHADIAAIQEAHGLMLQAQEMAEQVQTIELPDFVWWLVGGALLGIILFAEVLVATFGPSAIWIGLTLAIGTALFTLYDRNRRRADAHVRHLEDQLRARVSDLLQRNFVLSHGGATLVSTPDLDALVLLADATAITDPDADITRRISAQIATLQARVESLIAAPGDWRRQELSVDLAGIQAQLDALPPPASATEPD